MSETYIKAEIVRPKSSLEDTITDILTGLLVLAMRTLIIWWAAAVWVPDLGLTYWQLVLPVYAVRALVGRGPLGRQMK